MTEITTWIDRILEVYFSAVALATLIVRFTPTLQDDNVLLSIIKFMGKYIAIYRGFRPVDDAEVRALEAQPPMPEQPTDTPVA